MLRIPGAFRESGDSAMGATSHVGESERFSVLYDWLRRLVGVAGWLVDSGGIFF